MPRPNETVAPAPVNGHAPAVLRGAAPEAPHHDRPESGWRRFLLILLRALGAFHA
jgi:hypothetical protein